MRPSPQQRFIVWGFVIGVLVGRMHADPLPPDVAKALEHPLPTTGAIEAIFRPKLPNEVGELRLAMGPAGGAWYCINGTVVTGKDERGRYYAGDALHSESIVYRARTNEGDSDQIDMVSPAMFLRHISKERERFSVAGEADFVRCAASFHFGMRSSIASELTPEQRETWPLKPLLLEIDARTAKASRIVSGEGEDQFVRQFIWGSDPILLAWSVPDEVHVVTVKDEVVWFCEEWQMYEHVPPAFFDFDRVAKVALASAMAVEQWKNTQTRPSPILANVQRLPSAKGPSTPTITARAPDKGSVSPGPPPASSLDRYQIPTVVVGGALLGAGIVVWWARRRA